ncbi:SDR family oxidoreductase [Rhizobium sp. AN80A]|uniref:dTDP-4-dehydrorhamnose reductase family protein n=1 Tax=Rhizobium sp. AN80A TaxID=3040673 RepID=UPI0024B39056|nr:SDR family oxidoreductase [Rhizobium sp. AN80A]
MTKQRTLVLGASGMLGSAVFRAFHDAAELDVVATVRSSAALQQFTSDQQSKIVKDIDVLDSDSLVSLLRETRPDAIINCVGLIKQLSASRDPLVALPLNALFPHKLARLAALSGARLIHISTDCVFSGTAGRYTEESACDARDLYGISKHLGEVTDYDNAVTLRTSIIGRELASSHSLVDWFLSQHEQVKGYRRAIFSGLPTCELAAIIKDFVLPNATLRGLYHVSAEAISKFDLLTLIAKEYKRDTEIAVDDEVAIDRSLDATRFKRDTGYVAADWPELIKRMRDNDLREDS